MVGHCGCNCFKCGIRNDCLQTLMERETSEQFLSYDLSNRFQEAEELAPYFDVFINKTKSGVRPFTAKMIINLVMKNLVITDNFLFSI